MYIQFKKMGTPFKPFTIEAWIGILCTTVYVAGFLHLLNEFETRRNVKGESSMKQFRNTCGKVAYGTIMSSATGDATAGGSVQEVPSVPEMLAVGGYAFFGLIVLTAYTASSAAFLVVESSSVATYGSIEEIFQAGEKICVLSGLANSITQFMQNENYRYENLILFKNSLEEINDFTCDGCCVGAILSDLLSKFTTQE